jgi:hypothetical protein
VHSSTSGSIFAFTEFKFCLMIVGVGLMTCRCMQASAGIAEVDTNRFHQAVAIAQGQSEFSLGIPFDELEPTDGFQSASWVSQPGYRPGEIPVQVSVSGEEETEVVYDISYRSENMDGTGHLRRIAIRVEWDRAGGNRGVYTIEGVRAG